MTKPKRKPKSQPRTARKTAKKAVKPSTTMKSKIRALKKQVRKSVSKGEVLVNGPGSKALESRQIQIEIADIEAKAATAATSPKRSASPATDQKLRKKIDSLRRKLSASPSHRARPKKGGG